MFQSGSNRKEREREKGMRQLRKCFSFREYLILADTGVRVCAILPRYLGDIACILRYKTHVHEVPGSWYTAVVRCFAREICVNVPDFLTGSFIV
jgi:hypothetical protein